MNCVPEKIVEQYIFAHNEERMKLYGGQVLYDVTGVILIKFKLNSQNIILLVGKM